MKIKLIFFIALLGTCCHLRAQGPQLPNGNFVSLDTIVVTPADTISDSDIVPAVLYFTPADWATLDGAVGTPLGITFMDSVDIAPDSASPYSLELIADTVAGQANNGIAVGFASVGTATFTGFNFTYSGIPFVFRPDTLTFDYQYTSPGGDSAGVFIDLVDAADTGILGTSEGVQFSFYTSSSWQTVSIPLDAYYTSSTLPDSLYLVFFASASPNPAVYGDTLHIDNVRFGYANVTQETVTAIGPTTFCAGDSVILSAPTNANYSYYQWYAGNAATPVPGANSSYYSPYTSGSYFVIIDSAGTAEVSTPVNVTVNTPVPGSLIAVAGGDTTNSLCFPSADTVYLYGSPAGGAFVATGVINDSTFVPYETGEFVLAYFYSDTNGCSGEATDTVDVSICAGLKSVSNSTLNLNLFPNPASNTLNIIANQDVSGFIMQLFDATGSLVSAQTLHGLTNIVNVSELASGAYIIQVIDKQNTPVSQNKFTIIR